MFSTLKRKLQRENSVISNDSHSLDNSKCLRPALPLGITTQEIQEMANDQVETLFDVFIGETGDISPANVASLRSLSVVNKRQMLKAHYQRIAAPQLSCKYSLEPFIKQLSTGKFDLKSLASLRILLASSPIGILESFLGQRGLDLLLEGGLGFVRKRELHYSGGGGAAGNQTKIHKYFELEMELLKIFKLVLAEIVGVHAFFDGACKYLKALFHEFYGSNHDSAKCIVDLLLYLSNLPDYSELLVNAFLRENNHTIQEMMTFFGTILDNVDGEVDVIVSFIELINSLCAPCKIEKRVLFRRELTNHGFDKHLELAKELKDTKLEVAIDKFVKQVQLDVAEIRPRDWANTFDSLSDSTQLEKTIMDNLGENIKLFSRFDPYYLQMLEKASRIVLLSGQGILPSVQYSFGINPETEQENLALQAQLVHLNKRLVSKSKELEAFKSENNQNLVQFKTQHQEEIELLSQQLGQLNIDHLKTTTDYNQLWEKHRTLLTHVEKLSNAYNELKSALKNLTTTIQTEFLKNENLSVAKAHNKLKQSEVKPTKLPVVQSKLASKPVQATKPSGSVPKAPPIKPNIGFFFSSKSRGTLPKQNDLPTNSTGDSPPKAPVNEAKSDALEITDAKKNAPQPIINPVTVDIFPKRASATIKAVHMARPTKKIGKETIWAMLKHKAAVDLIDFEELDNNFVSAKAMAKKVVPEAQAKATGEVKKCLDARLTQLLSIVFAGKGPVERILNAIETMDSSTLPPTFLSQLTMSYEKYGIDNLVRASLPEIERFEMPEYFFLRMLQIPSSRERLDILCAYRSLSDDFVRWDACFSCHKELLTSLTTSAYVKQLLNVILIISNYLNMNVGLYNAFKLQAIDRFLTTTTFMESIMAELVAKLMLKHDPKVKQKNYLLLCLCKNGKLYDVDEINEAFKLMADKNNKLAKLKEAESNSFAISNLSKISSSFQTALIQLDEMKREMEILKQKFSIYFMLEATEKFEEFFEMFAKVFERMHWWYNTLNPTVEDFDEVNLVQAELHKEPEYLTSCYDNGLQSFLDKVGSGATSLQLIEESLNAADLTLEQARKEHESATN